jgi:hypothetical protein
MAPVLGDPDDNQNDPKNHREGEQRGGREPPPVGEEHRHIDDSEDEQAIADPGLKRRLVTRRSIHARPRRTVQSKVV